MSHQRIEKKKENVFDVVVVEVYKQFLEKILHLKERERFITISEQFAKDSTFMNKISIH
jgi:hypothetical protein